MKKLHFDCQMGAAGDMLTAALYELLTRPEQFLEKMGSLGLPGVEIEAEKSVKCGVVGTRISVKIDGAEEFDEHLTAHSHGHAHPHEHSRGHSGAPHRHSRGRAYSYDEICSVISSLDISDKPKSDALAVYGLIAKAEAKIHGGTESSVHFHEVGALDAIADIVGVCVLIDMLGADEITCSPVHVGSGTVRCEHGVLPVPAPAAAALLEGIPIYGGEIDGELCTPTGAALLRHFVTRFGSMGPLVAEKIGYGMGKKDFDRCNCVRAILGESFETIGSDRVVELCCNLDDMTGEALGFAMRALLDGGALDVFLTPVYMKKSRPAYMLTALCRPEDDDRVTQLIFCHTTTIGVRRHAAERSVLSRRVEIRNTRFGDVRVKVSEGFGVRREKPEHGDVAGLAGEYGVTLDDVLKEL